MRSFNPFIHHVASSVNEPVNTLGRPGGWQPEWPVDLCAGTRDVDSAPPEVLRSEYIRYTEYEGIVNIVIHHNWVLTDSLQAAERSPQPTKHAPIVNPADKYAEKGEILHKYGQYLVSCLPKYIQQCVTLRWLFRIWAKSLQVLCLER